MGTGMENASGNLQLGLKGVACSCTQFGLFGKEGTMADLFIVKIRLKLMLWFVGVGFAGGLLASWDAWRHIGVGREGLEPFLFRATVTGALAVAWVMLLVAFLSAHWFMNPRRNSQGWWTRIPWWVLGCVALLAFITALAVVFPRWSATVENEFGLLRKGWIEVLGERIAENPELLENKERKSGKSLLALALEDGNVEAVEMLLSSGAELASETNGPCWVAVMLDNPPMLGTLLRHGADPNAPDANSLAPIHYAVGTQNTNALALLFEAGADVDARNASHQTPLLLAIMDDDLQMVGTLLEHGADPNPWDRTGDTALHKAVRRRNPEAVRFLLENGADPKAFNFSNMAPIHIAALNGQDELVELLLEYPGMADLHSEKGAAPIEDALRGRKYDTVQLLLEHGADIDRVMENGYTALHLMLIARDYRTVRFLIAEGADVHIANADGETAHDFMRKKQLHGLLDLVDARDNPPEPAATNAVDAVVEAEAPSQ